MTHKQATSTRPLHPSRATRQQLITAALLDLGYAIEPAKTTKATTFRYARSTPDQQPDLLFVGKLGSVRFGRNYSSSNAAHQSTIGKLLDKGAKVLQRQFNAAKPSKPEGRCK